MSITIFLPGFLYFLMGGNNILHALTNNYVIIHHNATAHAGPYRRTDAAVTNCFELSTVSNDYWVKDFFYGIRSVPHHTLQHGARVHCRNRYG